MLNLALRQWRTREKSLGVWFNLSNVQTAETLARMGFDWLCIDLQHGLSDYRDLTYLLPALTGLPVTPLVRVARNQPDQIGKALDAGAHGVIVPMVSTVEDAKAAVSACRYPPKGLRSCGPIRAAMVEGADYLQIANEQVACVVMIETGEGLRNVDAIAAVEGVDGLFIGPMDLCYGLGLKPGSFEDPRYGAAVAAILKACRDHGCAAGTFAYTPGLAVQAFEAGFDFVSVGTDIGFLRAGAEQCLMAVRGASSSGKPSGY